MKGGDPAGSAAAVATTGGLGGGKAEEGQRVWGRGWGGGAALRGQRVKIISRQTHVWETASLEGGWGGVNKLKGPGTPVVAGEKTDPGDALWGASMSPSRTNCREALSPSLARTVAWCPWLHPRATCLIPAHTTPFTTHSGPVRPRLTALDSHMCLPCPLSRLSKEREGGTPGCPVQAGPAPGPPIAGPWRDLDVQGHSLHPRPSRLAPPVLPGLPPRVPVSLLGSEGGSHLSSQRRVSRTQTRVVVSPPDANLGLGRREYLREAETSRVARVITRGRGRCTDATLLLRGRGQEPGSVAASRSREGQGTGSPRAPGRGDLSQQLQEANVSPLESRWSSPQ